MGQPNLANQTIKPLLSIGPVTGLDASTDPSFVDGMYATDLLNIVPNRTYGAYNTMRGRVSQAGDIDGTFRALTLWYPNGSNPDLVSYSSGTIFAHKPAGPSNWITIAVPTIASLQNQIGQFASYLSYLFFSNSDKNAQAYKFDESYNATYWGISPPPNAATSVVSSPADGQIWGAGYYWEYTYANSLQESSPSPPLGPQDLGIALGPPGSNSALVTQNPAPIVTVTTGTGSVPPGTYFVGITYISPSGESQVSIIASASLGSTGELKVHHPTSPPGGVTAYNTYVGTSSSTISLQGGQTAIGSDNTLTAYTAGTATPPAFTGNLQPPPAPTLTAVTFGSLPARTEYFELTYTAGPGAESLPSAESSINLLQGQVALVTSPPQDEADIATGYNVYASQFSTQEVLQNAAPFSIGTPYNAALLTLGQTATLTLHGSPDPQVTDINIYRIGGALGQWLFVGSVPNVSSGTTTFVDNTEDQRVTGQALVLHRDPPAPFNSIFEHKERMMGFGYNRYTDFNGAVHPAAKCDLWYSNYAEPWGFDNTNQVIPVGAHDVGDVGVVGFSLSSIGVLLKSKTAWALYGESPSDFFVQKIFDVGCVGLRCAIVFLGVLFWLSDQGVYSFDGSSLNYLSKDIKKILDSFSASDFRNCTTMADDRIIWFSFPTQGITLGYDTVGQKWWKSSFSSPVFAFDAEGVAARPTAPDFVFGASGSNLDQWFAAETDLGEPIGSYMTSKLGNSGPVVGTFRVRYVELMAALNIPNDDTVSVTVACNTLATVPPAFTQAFTASNLPRQLLPAPPGLQGQNLQITVAASTSQELILESATAHGWVRRLYNVLG